jgi:serine/threonine-protein kinase
MVGQTIVHYKLFEKLGSGGMGEIYKAEDTRLHRMVAVKVLSPSLSADPERRKRFLQEAQAASALNHPNIITVFDIVADGDTQCIVMEYVDGKTLRDITPPGGLNVPQALQYAVQMAGALSVAHTAGIIHRDLKPSNVMVTNSGLVKILDFGLAKFMERLANSPDDPTIAQDELTREGSIIGTVSYMSPEQAEGKKVDARSDIFAFGSVLYELLTGKRAFEGTSGISTLSAILRDEVKPIYEIAPDVPPLLEQIVLRCLQKDPDARWPSMKQVEGALTTLQRQLDPGGEIAAALSSTNIPAAPAVSGAPSVAVPPPAVPPSPPPTGARPSAPSAAPRPPAAAKPATAKPVTAKPAAAKSPAAARKSSPMAIVWALLGVLLIGSAGFGWWWTHRKSLPPPPSLPAQTQAPEPEKPSPVAENPPPPAAPVEQPAPPAEQPAATSPDAKKTVAPKTAPPKTAPPKTVAKKTTAPPPPSQLAPIQPPSPPQPVKAEEPKAPPPTIPKPAVQLVRVAVNDGLPFRIFLADDVPSGSPEGTPIRFTVAEDFRVGDQTVVAKGATVTGSILSAAGKKKFLGIGSGKEIYQLQQVDAVDGRKLSVRAMSGHSGDGPVARPFETPKAPKKKGFAAVQGTEYIAYTDGDQTVSIRK